MDQQIQDALEQFRKTIAQTRPEVAAIQREARSLVEQIMSMCPDGMELHVVGAINPHKYAPMPTDVPDDSGTHYDHVEYAIQDKGILNEKGVPVDSSADAAEKFLKDCRTGLLALFATRIKEYIRSSGL